jgi:hypothetical protein
MTASEIAVGAEFTVPARFTLDTDQNPYLAPGTTRVDAVVTVTATGGGAPADALEIIVVDCSGSMAGEKIRSPGGPQRRRSPNCATARRSRS